MSLSSLFAADSTALGELLRELAIDGQVAVIGSPRLAQRLGKAGHRVICAVADGERAPKRGVEIVHATGSGLPLDSGIAAAAVLAGARSRDDWEPWLGECARVTRTGGPVVLVDRADPELCRRVLCAGLVDLRQRPRLTWGTRA